ncbi:hypothetical protein, partial [Pyrobaculum sp.]|uniref:hypothetical protein n=1 Tax=Pyrobaculum sp. TaxID=2004705 RepID=UPI003D0CAC0F
MAAVEAIEVEDLISASFPIRPVRHDPSPEVSVRGSPFLYVSKNSGVHVFAPLYTYRTYSAG